MGLSTLLVIILCCSGLVQSIPSHIRNESPNFGLQKHPSNSGLIPNVLQRRAGPPSQQRARSSAASSSMTNTQQNQVRPARGADTLNRDRAPPIGRSKSLPARLLPPAGDVSRSKSVPPRNNLGPGNSRPILENTNELESHPIIPSTPSSPISITSPQRPESRSSRSMSRTSSSSWSRSPSPNRGPRPRPDAAAAIEVTGATQLGISTSELPRESEFVPRGSQLMRFETGRNKAKTSAFVQGGSASAAVGGNRVAATMHTGPYGYGVINPSQPGQEPHFIPPSSSVRFERGTVPSDAGQARLEAEVFYDGHFVAKGRN